MWKLQEQTMLDTCRSMVSAWSSSTPRSLTLSENWRLVPTTLTPPEMSTLLSLDEIPNTTASVLMVQQKTIFKEPADDVVNADDQWRHTVEDRNVLASKLKLGKLILRKIIKTVATRCHSLKIKCIKSDFGWSSTPNPAGELTALPKPLSWI